MKQQKVPFPLGPIETATVSVISEATASAAIPNNEKINFHIGNPLQDERLVNRYFELCTGYSKDVLTNPANFELSAGDLNKLSFIYSTIQNAVPYTPRGGFSVKNPPAIMAKLQKWLLEQDEPLLYSSGETSARECIISNGGVNEFLRILFSLIERFSVNLPAYVVTVNFSLPSFSKSFKSIIPGKEISNNIENDFFEQLTVKARNNPIIVLIGRKLNENERALFRKLSLRGSFLFCELLDLKNNQSLAREAGLKENVIRLLTAEIFDKNLKNSATQFVLGNSEFLKLYASVHFELKGTPSSSELDWLEFALQNPDLFGDIKPAVLNSELQRFDSNPFYEKFKTKAFGTFNFEDRTKSLTGIIERVTSKSLNMNSGKLNGFNKKYTVYYNDDLEFKSASSLIPSNLLNPKMLLESFVNQFVKHHKQYNIDDCFAVSGSARTSLSLIGRHCNIEEVVTFDWSWSYENGFYTVDAVPLIADGELNTKGLINKLTQKVSENPLWKKTGAVILNNPHNASGKVFEEAVYKRLLITLLDQDYIVIDDLCYQDVSPSRIPVKIKTLKELGHEAVQSGLLASEKLKNLITAHSLSKTDCFAGARLTVVEIAHPAIKEKFALINETIIPNITAVLLAYLFYRNENTLLKQFWNLRNEIFAERADAIHAALKELPAERNPFKIDIILPQGAMYPQMIVENFPAGISIDNIATKLSSRGIGVVPLTAFSKTKAGYEGGRKTFRLTLGGTDNAETMGNKTRRLLIELNRLLREESSAYHLLKTGNPVYNKVLPLFSQATEKWKNVISQIQSSAGKNFNIEAAKLDSLDQKKHFFNNYLPWRIKILNDRFIDIIKLFSKVVEKTQTTNPKNISAVLEKELFKDDIHDRQIRFKKRLFDRTVHPTQMYSLAVDILVDRTFSSLIYGSGNSLPGSDIGKEIVKEYFGINIAINSEREAYELIYDLRTMVRNELYSDNYSEHFLSFWGDWDGSTRPSGQGHRLVAAVAIENVRHLAYFLKTIHSLNPSLDISASLISELQSLPQKNIKFWELLNKITSLTNLFEKNYKGLLPANISGGTLKQIAVKLKVNRDPLKSLFLHNSRLERKMLGLRKQRRISLEYYFELNKSLRKKLRELIPFITKNLHDPKIALLAGGYRNLLRRFVLTPRIHQKTITSADPFTIENTVHNMSEINQIGARYGNPGLILALQISMSTKPEALMDLSRMVSRKRESINQEENQASIKDLWLIPLFEDQDTVNNLDKYLNPVWNFAENTRSIGQTINERFLEITCEIFVAGSDLSQQVGQPESLELYKRTKAFFYKWLAQKGLLDDLRIKLGCGEPMQRQGGYYSDLSGKSALFDLTLLPDSTIRGLSKPAQKSLKYATSPLAGLHSGGDLRTIQSNAAEKIFRFINFEDRAQLLHHLEISQSTYKRDLSRVGKMFLNTRRDLEEKGFQEINRISRVSDNPVFMEFLKTNTESFRQIIYGKNEDVIGIHVISYFISRMVPPLRDRPTVRPSKDASQNTGQRIMERIAQTLPLSHHGSMLRAIGHNRSQSVILGICQLSTGIFRSLKIITEKYENADIITHVLNNLPVREILYDLQLYQQTDMIYIKKLEKTFKSGNSALHALFEDMEYMYEFIPYLQKALIAQQGLAPAEFFVGSEFKTNLLPYFRPDLAVLLQKDLFNTDISKLGLDLKKINTSWLAKVKRQLVLPNKLKLWREEVWKLIENKIFQQVSSFVDLALALTTLAQKSENGSMNINMAGSKKNKLAGQVNTMLSGSADDSMRNFLYSVVEYVSSLPQDKAQLPIDTLRVLHDIERIVKIDAQPLSIKEQSKLNYFILQMARIAKENG